MSISASFAAHSVAVVPGDEAAVPVQVVNSGTTVEELRFEPVGPCAGWATVEPERLSLFPGAAGTAEVRLRPPRESGTAPGEFVLGLRAVPTSDANEPVVAERPVTVLPFTEVTAELLPRASHGAWRGRHKAAVDNRGNIPLAVALTAQGAGDRVRFALEPAELTVPPGQTVLARLGARPARRMWRGTPVTHPFQVLVAPRPAAPDDPADQPAEQPAVLDGAYEQQAILPRWLPRAVAAAVVAAGVLVGLWFGVLRPTVRSAARDAITPDALRSAASAATVAPSAGGASSGTAGGPSADPSGGTGQGTTAGTGGSATSGTSSGASGAATAGGSATPAVSAGTGAGGPAVPTSARTSVDDPVGGGPRTGTAYTVAKGKTFGLTDIVVQNPQGDAGTLVVATQDGQVLSLALEDFRSSDYHFVTPIEVAAGGRITMSVDCREVGRPVKAPVPAQCAESLFLGGTLQSAGTGNPGT
ncbi:COG1470 family protein [Actinacidiphila acididurans]|uniref:Hydrolytic protein n=1 Tax=Actinacidiphila acididurans TaxID=2784346 RepID=A0ABS2TTL7_9ACTN|nr:hypothetical protein [Actinacidiphila acididurans]MBM9506688.1 hypothetical protein [Actinacidiphila acididurans]